MKKSALILIGLPASGKSTIAPLLARRLGWEWKDTDGCLEVWWEINHGSFLTCRELYRKAGESLFREFERKAIQQLEEIHSVVLATGGGTMLNRRTALFLKEKGTMVYLRQSIARSKERLPSTTAFSLNSLQNRLPFYEEFADITIEAETLTPAQIVDSILEAYGKQ